MLEYTTIEPWVGGYEMKIYHESFIIIYAHKRSRHQRKSTLAPPMPQEMSRMQA